MNLSDIKQLANLAQLGLSPDESLRYAEKLTAIFAYVQKIDQINTDSILPMAHPIPLELKFNQLREDVGHPINQDQKDLFLNLSLQSEQGFFTTPPSIE